MKVVGAGFGRTGTLSLKTALEELGFGPCYHMVEVFAHPEHTPLWEAAWRGDLVGWEEILGGYEAAVDWPACAFYEQLMERYPAAKVILTVRDPERWYESTRSTIYELSMIATRSPLFRLVFGAIRLLRFGRIGRGNMAEEIIWQGTFDGRFEDRRYAIEVFEWHNEEVRRRVPEEKLLVYEVSEGWSPCASSSASRSRTNPSRASTIRPRCGAGYGRSGLSPSPCPPLWLCWACSHCSRDAPDPTPNGERMDPIREVTVQTDVPAVMRDGTTLMANVYGPADGGPYPVLLARMPYGKDLPFNSTYLDPLKVTRRGYIVAIQDVRGRYTSEGKFTPFVNEFEDGYDSVEWAASLPGSSGAVGMIGLSYLGKAQWHAAVMQPPSLKSMAPGQTWGNHLNGAQMRGGARELGLIQYWAQAVLALGIHFRRYRGEPEQIGQKLANLVGSIDALLAGGGYDTLPLTQLPDPDGLTPFVRGGFVRGADHEGWDYLNIDGRYDRVQVPTFHIGGWYDCFVGETLRQYAAMKERAGATGGRSPRLLVGPWTHGDFESTSGDVDFGLGSSGALLDYRGDLTGAHLRWFDATLKGEEGPLEERPPVEIFVMGENRWRGYAEWPVPGAREERWHLHGDGRLSREAPGQSAPDLYDYDPEDPVPTVGGAILMAPIHRPGARDQREVEARPDVLLYTSEVLREDYTALGPVHATLFAATSAPDTDFVVRLVDVYPDGRAIVVTDGVIRASQREGFPAPGVIRSAGPKPVEPGRVYEYRVDLWATGITFRAGHRIRVQVASSSFPRWDRNPNTGEGPDSARTEVARQRIFHDPEHPSHLTLTVVDR